MSGTHAALPPPPVDAVSRTEKSSPFSDAISAGRKSPGTSATSRTRGALRPGIPRRPRRVVLYTYPHRVQIRGRSPREREPR
ncbi:hypothetical protein FM112_10215 [Gulosibacter sp. 10]|nr:hypothetical protein FM112_10215 [Gulosibacter sp. 10]